MSSAGIGSGAPHHGTPRDFVGYGASPPQADWPGGARLALNFVINVEEGAERSIPDGDGRSEWHLTEVSPSPVPTGSRDLGAESMFEYGARVGFWRLHRLFMEAGFPVTAFACGQALERNPAIAAAIAAAGWDICAHGQRWVEHFGMDEATERREIAAAVAAIRRCTGQAPAGWYCRYAPSPNTRRLLIEHGGFRYDSDAYNDELPYWVQVAGQAPEHEPAPHLVVPYSLTNNDVKFGRGQVATAGQFFELLRDAFDMLYAEGATAPKMMSVGLHQRVVGHPARAMALARFIEHVAGHEAVWVCRRADIAEHWYRHHAPT